MLGKIFLGKFWHWVLLAVAAVLLWYAGSKRLHVIEFNLFILAMLGGTVLVLVFILRYMKPGEQVTRDRIVDSSDD